MKLAFSGSKKTFVEELKKLNWKVQSFERNPSLYVQTIKGATLYWYEEEGMLHVENMVDKIEASQLRNLITSIESNEKAIVNILDPNMTMQWDSNNSDKNEKNKFKYKVSVEKFEEDFNNIGWNRIPYDKTDGHRFDSPNGAIVIWFEKSGYLYLKNCYYKHEFRQVTKIIKWQKVNPESKKVFIVYGHDHDTRDSLEWLLLKWGIHPIILDKDVNSASHILTNIIEKIRDCFFGIILLTPDDEGYDKCEGELKSKNRARQNVILEMGILLGLRSIQKSLGGIMVIYKDDVELPSDISGIHYNSFVKNIESELSSKILNEIRTAEKNADTTFQFPNDWNDLSEYFDFPDPDIEGKDLDDPDLYDIDFDYDYRWWK